MSRRMICSLVLFAIAPIAVAGDWPQWRGPNRDGVSTETGLLPKWPADGPPVAWKAEGLGGGYSTPSVANGKIYGMGYIGDDEVVWALDEKTGKVLWKTKIAGLAKAGYGEGSRCTPTINDGHVYVVGMGSEMACLTADKGEVVWKKNLMKDFGGKMMSGWGYSESPLVDGDHVICTPGGDKVTLLCLNKKSGSPVWESSVPNGGGAGYASVIKTEVGGVAMYVTWLRNACVGVSAKDGKYLWRSESAAGKTANIPTVVAKDDMIVCSTGYTGAGGITGVQLTADKNGGVTAKEVWTHPSTKIGNHHGGMVLLGDYLYFGHGQNKGQPTCIEFKTGKIMWGPEREPEKGSGSAAIVAAEGKLYMRFQNHVLALIEADPKELKPICGFKLPEPSGKQSWPHPVIANGKLYIRDQDKMFCFNIKAG